MALNPALLNRDYALLIDRSGSMRTADAGSTGTQSRWAAVEETSIGVASKLAELSPEGIFFQVFSTAPVRYTGVKADKVEQIFKTTEPGGSTALHLALAAELDDYLVRKAAGKTKANGEAIFVVTDGEPDDQAKVAKVIVNAANRLTNPDELNITFVQVGHDDKATAFLNRLDDDLEKEGAKYDIVDTLTVESIGKKNLTAVTDARKY
jgi:hypothetical protein